MKYIKTETGQQAFKERSGLISPRQRPMFILFDGVKTVEQVLAASAGLGATQSDVDHLLAQGLIGLAPEPLFAPVDNKVVKWTALDGTVALRSNRSAQERYTEAMPIATQLVASMGLSGYLLNLAVESADGYEGLLAVFPKIHKALGSKACKELDRALNG
ncbi:hypothetical protein [Rhodoferax aquaticus]|uniref:Uncharacterized protein n=1 Tax=Rhodoferax aquaticus TaxID=2527691 RepID=A0A515ETK1_9BURK|nr:hypothetical protein [Rhodoferax aquaticus]QDL56007.1 hypothetical protein EXZ61_18495 [Rhodoferax aquaticus]